MIIIRTPEQQRAEARKGLLFELTMLCKEARDHADRHKMFGGDVKAADEWMDAHVRTWRALLSVRIFCDLMSSEGVDTGVIADVQQLSTLLQVPDTVMTRQ